MDLGILWFILIGVLYVVFFVLEGFDFGVGILAPFVAKSDPERRAVMNAIGPHWDANEVWLITAGGATFAAFPQWYATMFSGFYLPLFLLLVALIMRGISLEFRSKDDHPLWRKFWDWAFFGGSLASALLLGVAFSNLARGIPIDANKIYTGGFWYLLNPYALLGGVVLVAACMVYGALFLSLKTQDDLRERARKFAYLFWLPMVVLLFGFIVATYIETELIHNLGLNPGLIPLISGVTALLAGLFIRRKQDGWAFIMMAIGIASSIATVFMISYPNVLTSTNPQFSITIQEAASSTLTLQIMTGVAIVFVPIVIAYQVWVYWLFRHRVGTDPEKLTY